MNILHLIDTTGPGGAETVFIELADRLREEGHHSTVVIRGEGWVHDELSRRGLEPIVLPCRGSFAVGFLRALTRLIRERRIDLIQSHLLGSNVYAAMAGMLTRRPVIATYHGMVDISPNERFRSLKQWVMRQGIDRYVVVSRRLLESIEGNGLIDRGKTRVIYNGVDVEGYPPARPISEDRQEVVIGSLGNIRPAKAYDVLLKAARLVIDRKPDVRFVIGGEGTGRSLYRELEALRDELKLEQQVSFRGFVEDTRGFLSELDLFLLTSSSEGFSIATIEAMACGLPVVATRCGGPEEIIDDGQDGRLVKANDPPAIARALLELLDDPVVTEKLASRGRQKVKERYSMETMIDRYQNLYREVSKR
jgi:glycosyltransferase involved in cell wall biosynthesis